MRVPGTRYFRRLCRGILQSRRRRLYTHVVLVVFTTVSGAEAALAHGSMAQQAWIGAAALSAACVTFIEGGAWLGGGRRLGASAKLPELPAFFVGRSADLDALEKNFLQQRQARRVHRNGTGSDPVLIYIYGPPGVGKSALAAALAHRIARYYPDQVLEENLGEAAAPRGSGEVLASLLKKLQVPDGVSDPRPPADRFQEICGQRRLLVILDAAQDASQIAPLLPRSPDCAAIITSRRRIGGAGSHLVQVPNTGEATEMLYSYAGRPPNSSPASVAEIVEMCGSLPSALRSAGAQVTDGRTFEGLAELLRPPERRLAQLDYGGYRVQERIRTEYDRLSERDKLAFCRLALLRSATFLPWVLAPLLNTTLDEASNVMTRLAEAQLVELADHDPSGLKRYRLHPLIWCFAASEVEQDLRKKAAEERIESYQLDVITEVLIRVDPALKYVLARRVEATGDLHWLDGIADTPSYWARAEFGSLVRAVETSFIQREYELCWRIAAQLGSCVPRYLHPDSYLPNFDQALSAAERTQDTIGQIHVLLAKAESLVALERYGEAFAAWRRAELMGRALPVSAVGSLFVARLRKEGEAWLQLGSYANAKTALERASARADELADSRERELIDILTAENDTSCRLELWQDEDVYQRAATQDDDARFRAHLGQSDAARRKCEWLVAHQHLDGALGPSYGDARRRASIEYRLGRLCLSQWRCEPRQAAKDQLATAAVGHSAVALLRFQFMGNTVGCVRARCLLARALIAAGQLAEAGAQIEHAEADVRRIAPLPDDAPGSILVPCWARIHRARGELQLRQRHFDEARRDLEKAAEMFRELSDGWSSAVALLLLGQACGQDGRPIQAMYHLYAARLTFDRCRDDVSKFEAIREQAMLASQQGKHAVARDYLADIPRGTR
jgi:tetratricopeptide (TPR) repeat protein